MIIIFIPEFEIFSAWEEIVTTCYSCCEIGTEKATFVIELRSFKVTSVIEAVDSRLRIEGVERNQDERCFQTSLKI